MSELKYWSEEGRKGKFSDRLEPWLYVRTVQEGEGAGGTNRLPFRVKKCLRNQQMQEVETMRHT
jgi:hypothetical protein